MPVPPPLEIIDAVMYDTLSIPFGMRSVDRAELFQIPLGGMAFHDPLTGDPRVKDYTETNMVIPGALPAPQSFLVHSIRAALFGRRGELLPIGSRYYRGIIVDLRINQKSYWNGPLWRVADPSVLFASSSALADFDKEERLELVRTLRYTFSEDPRPMIQAHMPFSVALTFDPSFDWPNVRSPGSLVVVLEGTLARAVV